LLVSDLRMEVELMCDA